MQLYYIFSYRSFTIQVAQARNMKATAGSSAVKNGYEFTTLERVGRFFRSFVSELLAGQKWEGLRCRPRSMSTPILLVFPSRHPHGSVNRSFDDGRARGGVVNDRRRRSTAWTYPQRIRVSRIWCRHRLGNRWLAGASHALLHPLYARCRMAGTYALDRAEQESDLTDYICKRLVDTYLVNTDMQGYVSLQYGNTIDATNSKWCQEVGGGDSRIAYSESRVSSI